MKYEFCSNEEFRQRAYDYLTEDLASKEGVSVEEVRRFVPRHEFVNAETVARCAHCGGLIWPTIGAFRRTNDERSFCSHRCAREAK